MEARKKRHICGSIHLTEWDGPYVTLYLTRVSKYLPIDRAYDHHVKTLMRVSLLDNNFIRYASVKACVASSSCTSMKLVFYNFVWVMSEVVRIHFHFFYQVYFIDLKIYTHLKIKVQT